MKSLRSASTLVGFAAFVLFVDLAAPVRAEGPASAPAASAPAGAPQSAPLPRIQEVWNSFGSNYDNTDSLAVATLPTGAVRLFATSKGGNWIDAYDAGSGAHQQRYGKKGAGPGEFDRPNGIASANITIDAKGNTRPALLIVERDNRRVQAIWADTMTPAGMVVENLDRPYGCCVATHNGELLLYITDEKAEPRLRVRLYKLMRDGDALKSQFVRGLGEEEGPGLIKKPESITVDPYRERLLVCDEATDQKCVKVFSITGKFIGKAFGGGTIMGDPEGLVVWRTPDLHDVVIVTDQRPEQTAWHVFGAEDYDHRLSFTGTQKIANTDGVAIFPEPLSEYSTGMFFAVNDDADIRGYDLSSLAAKLKGLKAAPAK